jgi:ParB-like chromosome segregation protein Spo0J
VTDELRIDAIDCDGRHRTDLGDIRALADSIDTIGLIHPVVVTPECKLIAGGRRLAAANSLGWDTIPVTVIHTVADATDALMAERDENTCRKDFTPVEAAAMRAAVAEAMRPVVEQERREAISKSRNGDGGNLPPSPKTRDVAAQGTGYSGKTLDKVDRVIEAAADESQPEPVRQTAREALNEMANTGKVDGPFKRTEEAKQDARLTELLGNDSDVQRAKYRQAFGKALGSFLEVLSFDPADVADALDAEQWRVLPMQIDTVNQWWKNVVSHRAGLKVVGGTDV